MTEGNWINLDALQLWERNYNRGDVAKIKRSVKKFGFNNALRVWNGTVMAGNHSTKALRELKAEGWTPTGGAIRVEGDAWLVQSVDLSHLRKDEAESFAIADNHIATEADPDMAALTALLKELELSMPDVVADIGFDEKEFAALMDEFGGSGEQAEAPEAQIDRAEELLAEWPVERGQLWIIPSKSGKGEHRLLCGDSTNADDVARVMGGQKANMAFIDPPYDFDDLSFFDVAMGGGVNLTVICL